MNHREAARYEVAARLARLPIAEAGPDDDAEIATLAARAMVNEALRRREQARNRRDATSTTHVPFTG